VRLAPTLIGRNGTIQCTWLKTHTMENDHKTVTEQRQLHRFSTMQSVKKETFWTRAVYVHKIKEH